MGELIPFQQKMTPEMKASAMQKLADVEVEIDVKYADIEVLERQREDLRRRLGFLAREMGLDG